MTASLRECLIDAEGYKKYAYQDSLGVWTIGVGRNIDNRFGKGLSNDEINYLLNNDIAQCTSQLENFNWYDIQDQVRKEVLIELCFNMGLPNLLLFNKMIASLSQKDYHEATVNLLHSKWATQVQKSRIESIVYRLVHGEYPGAPKA